LAGYYFPFSKIIAEIMKENKLEKEIQKNFYIVIDEINRGNISKIFGELITLIEEDKRDKYEVKLPYSKESFKVPSNLYIIATMNSTDKSIATIDIALRRRFTFLKMRPNEDLVKNEQANIFMHKANEYIKEKKGEDYILGHSYFMQVTCKEDLDFVKEYKIKPLLEEYFYVEEKSADDILEEIEKVEMKENNE
jgi:5-methylcytosine-specific restriction enzyme B